ncbi:uncharacterized protein RHO17_025793 [Thomomys bottae]
MSSWAQASRTRIGGFRERRGQRPIGERGEAGPWLRGRGKAARGVAATGPRSRRGYLTAVNTELPRPGPTLALGCDWPGHSESTPTRFLPSASGLRVRFLGPASVDTVSPPPRPPQEATSEVTHGRPWSDEPPVPAGAWMHCARTCPRLCRAPSRPAWIVVDTQPPPAPPMCHCVRAAWGGHGYPSFAPVLRFRPSQPAPPQFPPHTSSPALLRAQGAPPAHRSAHPTPPCPAPDRTPLPSRKRRVSPAPRPAGGAVRTCLCTCSSSRRARQDAGHL